MNEPYIVLGTYKPTVLDKAWKVGEFITDFTRRWGLIPLYDPEHPAQSWAPWNSRQLHAEVKKTAAGIVPAKANCWHYDGDTTPGSRTEHALVFWSSVAPTEIRFNGQEKIYRPKPWEIVILHNLHCLHRRPDDAPFNRFIFRQRCEVPKHILLP
ncbi:MAG: hypothetical protein MN733_26975 [Nitrososphaera sp.]|nr:hypothetical protein [Nitrososphaera sp.]